MIPERDPAAPVLEPRTPGGAPKRGFEAAIILATIGFLIIFGRFFYLQVVAGNEYEALARIHHVGSERLPARRGLVKDRRGRLLSRNIANHQLSVIPHYVKEPERELGALRDLLGWSEERYQEILAKVLAAKEGKRRFNKLPIVRDLVSTRCPHDQTELDLTEEHPGRWCSECGRHFHPMPTGKRICAAGHKLESGPKQGSAFCPICDIEFTDAEMCPHDGTTLRGRSTLLSCQTCKRRFNNEEAMVRTRLHDLPGVYLDTEMRRHYAERDLMGHVLGYMNQVNDRDIEAGPDTFKPGDYIGRAGVERSLEDVLRGEHGVEVFVKDARGLRLDEANLPPEVAEQQGRPAVNGLSLGLSIDIDLQRVAKEALRYHRSGAVVAMDPHSGEVLALYSKPGFDPNVWSGRLTAAAKAEFDNNPYAPMINKATTAYAPGSIYKVVTALAGLREGITTKDTGWACPGYYEFGGRRFRCHRRTGHGPGIKLRESLVLSCDVYYYILGEILGMDRLHHYGADIFMLGQKTGIDLPESVGRVPSKDWYRKYGHIGWQPGFTLSVSVGQGALTTTPIQMARLYSALVNGGLIYRPLLVRQLEDEHGNIVRRIRPEIQGKLPFDEVQIKYIRDALVDVVNDKEMGTATGVRMESLVIAGKTGTAEARMVSRDASEEVANWLLQDHAWFASYAPAADPQIVVIAFVEHGGSGGKVAAPVAKHVLEQYFKRGIGEQRSEDARPGWRDPELDGQLPGGESAEPPDEEWELD